MRACVVKTMLGKQVYTSPEGWKLPKTINDEVINSMFKLTGQKKAEDIKLRAGEFKIACVRHARAKVLSRLSSCNGLTPEKR